MPDYAAAPALPNPPTLTKRAHRPEPVEPPSSPPVPAEPDTFPGPEPVPIEPPGPTPPPIGDPPPQPTQTPQAGERDGHSAIRMQL